MAKRDVLCGGNAIVHYKYLQEVGLSNHEVLRTSSALQRWIVDAACLAAFFPTRAGALFKRGLVSHQTIERDLFNWKQQCRPSTGSVSAVGLSINYLYRHWQVSCAHTAHKHC